MRSRSWAPAAASVGLWALLAARAGIGPALGMGRGAVDSLAVLRSLAAGAGAVGVAWAVLRVGRFRSVAPVSAVATVLSGFANDPVGLLGLQVAAGATSPPAAPDSRASRAVAMAGAPVGIALAAFVTLGLGLTWRVVLWAAGGLAVVSVVAAGRGGEAEVAPSSELRFGEQVRRLLLLRTTAPVLGGYVVSGMASLPLVVYLSSHLQQRWDFGPGAVAGVAVVALAASAAAVAAGRRPVPADIALWAGALALLATAAAPVAAVAVVGAVLAFAAFGAGVGALDATVRRVVPAELRPVATALQAAAASLVGVAVGFAQFAGIERRFGNGGALVSLAFTAWLVGGGLRKAAAFVDDDVQRVADEAAERVRVAALRARGERPPMLACRGVDFSYGPMQVLFGVDFSVEDGELVALLGTNGAGKSTLLRVVSGLGLPSAGTVLLDGTDITHWGAERRVGAGITQISGGRAVFGPLSVAENLRLFGYREGRSGRAVDEGIDATFAHFPVLAERRNQAAQTLSGGEQQMLALGKALILKPRLLLVDELSLGLAPVVVAALIPMVREINSRGTSVVVVEQSVNVALTLAEHAYFMEKGEIRFDGKAKDLLDRPDILRSVFLEGAVKRGLAG